MESAEKWAWQAQHYEEEVDRRRKAVDMEEEASFRVDSTEDQLKTVGREREDEKAKFERKVRAAEDGAKAMEEARDVARADMGKVEGELRETL